MIKEIFVFLLSIILTVIFISILLCAVIGIVVVTEDRLASSPLSEVGIVCHKDVGKVFLTGHKFNRPPVRYQAFLSDGSEIWVRKAHLTNTSREGVVCP